MDGLALVPFMVDEPFGDVPAEPPLMLPPGAAWAKAAAGARNAARATAVMIFFMLCSSLFVA